MKRLIFTLAFGLAIQTTSSYAQFAPHPEVDYRENFRGQFHFSPKTEWMNDVNALMYHDGKYHMIYQWGKKIRHGGYDIVNEKMCVGLPKGKPKDLSLKPDEYGILEIRMLVDWAQLEIFSASGVYSASYQLGFKPDDSTVGLSATGGEVKLVSLVLNEVGSIWPKIKGE